MKCTVEIHHPNWGRILSINSDFGDLHEYYWSVESTISILWGEYKRDQNRSWESLYITNRSVVTFAIAPIEKKV